MSAPSTGKWRLHFGIHAGTITSRDVDTPTLHDTEQEARAEFARAKAYFARIGYLIWFADLYDPDGKRTTIEPGAPYAG